MRYPLSFITALLIGSSAFANNNITCNNFGHFDLIISVENNKITVDGDETFPRNKAGHVVAPADFGDFVGGPHKTDNPGWVTVNGHFQEDETLWFRAINNLRFWDKNQEKWLDTAPREESVHYFASIPSDKFFESGEKSDFKEVNTIFTTNAIQGPNESVIEPAGENGAIHTHLEFCLQDNTGDCTIDNIGSTGSPTIGAYAITIQLFSDAGNRQKYIPSDPINIILNNGLQGSECNTAIDALKAQSVETNSAPLPGAGILIL